MNKITLNFFIDAFGWEMLKENPFLPDLLTCRYKLKSVYGYSSACVPSILFGSYPDKHGFWSTYYYSPESSPFKFLAPLSYLPKIVMNRSRIRHHINKLVKKKLMIEGYFNLYQFPFNRLKHYDYNEKINFYTPGVPPVKSIFDRLYEKKVPYYSFSVEKKEEAQWKELKTAIEQGEIKFSYISLGRIDALLHMNERSSKPLKDQLAEYSMKIREIYNLARTKYDEVVLNVFSDHDMAPITGSISMMKEIEQLNIRYGIDYAGVYDSTMARFWFFSREAEVLVRNKLATIEGGRIMPLNEIKELGAYFPDNKFGDLIFQLNEGMIINPSYMGDKVISGMHGYHPDNKFSYAAFSSTHKPGSQPESITDIHNIMLESIND